jgi:hypothetical protein
MHSPSRTDNGEVKDKAEAEGDQDRNAAAKEQRPLERTIDGHIQL